MQSPPDIVVPQPAPTQGKAKGWSTKYPGVAISVVAGICAQAIAIHYGAPPMLIALLLGLSLHFISDFERVKEGIQYAARDILRFGVALLGLKIAVADIIAVGLAPLILVAIGMVATMISAVFGARVLGLSREFAALSGGSVAVCGASAAAAVSSVLKPDKNSERDLAVVIAVVTVLATVAMILYPLMLTYYPFTPHEQAVVLGGTIHDVAQVVAAGNTISPDVGKLSTFVKLVRVALLLPIVMGVFFWLGDRSAQKGSGQKVSYVPPFLIAFFVLAAINSFVFPQFATQPWVPFVKEWGDAAAKYMLVIAITAIGIKTNLRAVFGVGWKPFALIVFETLVLLIVVLGGVYWMHG